MNQFWTAVIAISVVMLVSYIILSLGSKNQNDPFEQDEKEKSQ